MPQHPSAIKRVRRNEQRRQQNRRQKAHVRALMKKLHATQDPEATQALLPEVKSALDRLAAKNIIHKNRAANYKSKLEKHVNSL